MLPFLLGDLSCDVVCTFLACVTSIKLQFIGEWVILEPKYNPKVQEFNCSAISYVLWHHRRKWMSICRKTFDIKLGDTSLSLSLSLCLSVALFPSLSPSLLLSLCVCLLSSFIFVEWRKDHYKRSKKVEMAWSLTSGSFLDVLVLNNFNNPMAAYKSSCISRALHDLDCTSLTQEEKSCLRQSKMLAIVFPL